VAATLLVLAIRKAGNRRDIAESAPAGDPDALARAAAEDVKAQRSFYPRLAALLVLVVLGSVAYAGAVKNRIEASRNGAGHQRTAALTGQFPQQMGGYTLARTWKEQNAVGMVVFEWAEYVTTDGTRIQIGISPVLSAHDTTLCHVARGEDAIWQGTINLPSAGHSPESFSTAMYNDGASQFIEASTQCTLAGCGEYTMVHSHFGIIFSRPQVGSLLQQPGAARPLPVLLRAETTDVAMPAADARAMLLEQMRGFTREINLEALTNAYRGPFNPDDAQFQ